ncbi:hypothetical protein HDV05_006413 [Chytridiales sp. JEL 0842]|nr:hypothetical protein HDV05_006413 [Chytridiales sp. JEL 0842]
MASAKTLPAPDSTVSLEEQPRKSLESNGKPHPPSTPTTDISQQTNSSVTVEPLNVSDESPQPSKWEKVKAFLWKHWFLEQANGDEAGALTNAAIGNILGVFLSPTLIFAYAGNLEAGGKGLDYKTTFIDLTITVIVPLIIGQCIQIFFPTAVASLSKRVNLAMVNSFFLLLLVWSVFCETFASNLVGQIDAPSLVAIVMCGATKTLALGAPMISIIYRGKAPECFTLLFAAAKFYASLLDSPLLGIVTAPLIVYHAEQLVVGSFMVDRIKGWVNAGKLPTPAVADE